MRDDTGKTNEEARKTGDPAEAADPATGRTRKRGRRRMLKWGGVAALAVAVAAGGYWYHLRSTYDPGTDDAYVKADTVGITPQVGGPLVKVPVADQQNVAKGALLFRIDPSAFRYRVAQAQAALDSARQTVAAHEAAVAAAKAHVVDQQAALRTAQRTYRRDQSLAGQKVVPQSTLTDAQDALARARAMLDLAKAQLNQAQKTLGQTGDANHQVEAAQARLDQAKLDLAHTRVTAPCAGRLTGFQQQVGDVVHAQSSLGTLVCNRAFWVYANYKETDITRIRAGQHVTVTVDMYPDKTFHGIVESIDPASGAAFSLLPPENASGNWVKVTQRVPVRILITDAGPNYPMRVQTSAEVTVDTGDGRTPLGKPRGVTLTDAQARKLAAAGGGGDG